MPYGLASAMTVVQALKDAGPDLSREKVLDALENIKLETNIMAAPVQFSPNEHAALKSAIYIKFDGENKELIPGTYKSVWEYKP